MSDTLIPSAAVAAVVETPAPASRTAKITCGYCDCTLAADGGVLRVSERSKDLNRQDEKLENLRAKIAQLETELSTAHAEKATAQGRCAELEAALKRTGKALDWDE